ncbi:MAG: methyl-accepting chemotaxis protein, partial [Gammaproteobacteria bacterium]|nr:methyl-accepting chemotaxis protein [Gammaproteobacteria bacterium]
MRIMNLNVRKKMAGMAMLLAIGLIIQIIFNYLSVETLSELDEVRVQSTALQSDMLMLRRHEKDFIARKDLKYVDKFETSFQQMMERITAIEVSLESMDLEVDEVRSISGILNTYKAMFLELVEQQKLIGLHAKDGLYGSLRKKVHSIEGLITGFEEEYGENEYTHSVMRTMLMLRRHEKDFMLRRNIKYLDKFNKRIGIMESKIKDAELGFDFESQASAALKGYQNDFYALAKAEERFGFTSKEGILGEMRDTIHQSESALDSLSDEMDIFVSSLVQNEKVINISTGLTLSMLIVILLMAISRGITSRIASFSSVMADARNDNDLTARASVSGNDEISSMASIYNEMMEEFRSLMDEVSSSSISLAAAAEQLGSATVQTADGVQRQLIESEQVATAMNEMSATVAEVANNASQAAESSSIADEA